MMLISNCPNGHRETYDCLGCPASGDVAHKHCADCSSIWLDGRGWHYPVIKGSSIDVGIHAPGTSADVEARVRSLEDELERWRAELATVKAVEEQMRLDKLRQAEESAAAHERVLEMAKVQWRMLRSAYTGNPAVGVVLELHGPDWGPYAENVVCDHCVEFNGYEDVQGVEWPCPTYAAVYAMARKLKLQSFGIAGAADDDD